MEYINTFSFKAHLVQIINNSDISCFHSACFSLSWLSCTMQGLYWLLVVHLSGLWGPKGAVRPSLSGPLCSLRPPPGRLQPGRSAGRRVAMLESLKAGLVGADCCLIVLFRAAVHRGLQQGCMRSGATAVDAALKESNLAGSHWTAEAKVSPVIYLWAEWRPPELHHRGLITHFSH